MCFCVCARVCLKAQQSVYKTRPCVSWKKKMNEKVLDFFLIMNCTFSLFLMDDWWLMERAFLELFLLFCFFTSFSPSCFPSFLKNKKFRFHTIIITTRSFCRLHQKLSKTAKIINNERSNFVTHRPSRDPNRELVLGTVLFRCVGLLFFFENFCLSFFQF